MIVVIESLECFKLIWFFGVIFSYVRAFITLLLYYFRLRSWTWTSWSLGVTYNVV